MRVGIWIFGNPAGSQRPRAQPRAPEPAGPATRHGRGTSGSSALFPGFTIVPTGSNPKYADLNGRGHLGRGAAHHLDRFGKGILGQYFGTAGITVGGCSPPPWGDDPDNGKGTVVRHRAFAVEIAMPVFDPCWVLTMTLMMGVVMIESHWHVPCLGMR